MIDQIWTEKTSANPRLYNASKFRLAEIQEPKDGKFLLEVGITCYKDLLGTHYCQRSSELVRKAKENQLPTPFAYMSNAIGVGAHTVTADNFVVLMQRAGWTGEGAGKVDRPGGHPEPDIVQKVRELLFLMESHIYYSGNIHFKYNI